MTTISAARYRQAGMAYKIKYKALKELEKGTTHKKVPKEHSVNMEKTRRRFSKRIKVGFGSKELNQYIRGPEQSRKEMVT